MVDDLNDQAKIFTYLNPAALPLAPVLSQLTPRFGELTSSDPRRDAELKDNYRSGQWVTRTIAIAASFLNPAEIAESAAPLASKVGGRILETLEELPLAAAEASQRPLAIGIDYKAIVGVERTAVELPEGYSSLGRELAFRVLMKYGKNAGKWKLLRFDELFVTPEGYLLNAESKFGEFAGFTENQIGAGVSKGENILAIPTRRTVRLTGLTPGEIVGIASRVFKWAWPL
jgi:hypothetical protein